MGQCGERCFSRYVLRISEETPDVFGRLVGILVYGLVLGLVTAGHKGLLLYFYYRFLEEEGEEPVPRAYLDGIPSYVTPAYVVLLLVVLPFLLCACCGAGCKVRSLVHWALALVIGSTISSLVTYSAQVILYVIRIVKLFMDKKAFLVAVCYCCSVSGLGNYTTELTTSMSTRSTHEMMTSHAPPFTVSGIGDVTMVSETIIVDETTISNERTQPATGPGSPPTGDYWCQCDVPYENYPVAIVTSDPEEITDEYLRVFGVDRYYGAVDVHVVNSTQQVKDSVDAELTQYKWFLGLLQGAAVILALRVPFWLVLNNVWSHVVLKETRACWGLDRTRHSRPARQPRRGGFGNRLGYFVSRSADYVDTQKPTSRQNSGSYDISWNSEEADNAQSMTYDAGLQAGIRKSRQLPDPPDSVLPGLGPLFLCLLETLDSFSLLDEILARKHYFRGNSLLATLTLATTGTNMAATMVINALIVVPNTRRGKGYLTLRFLMMFIANAGLLSVRIWLLVKYDLFDKTLVSSSFLLYVVKEVVLIVYGLVELGMGVTAERRKDSRRHTAEVLGRWRNYTDGVQGDKTDAVWMDMSRGRVQTIDTASNTDDGVSISGHTDTEFPVYSARNQNYRREFQETYENGTGEPTLAFQRNFRYSSPEGPVYGESCGINLSQDDLVDSSSHLDGGSAYGSQNVILGGVGTFTKRDSKKKKRQNPVPDFRSTSSGIPGYKETPIDLSEFRDGQGGYIGPALLDRGPASEAQSRVNSGHSTSRTQPEVTRSQPRRSPKYTERELENMIFFI